MIRAGGDTSSSAALDAPLLLVHGFAQTAKSWQTVIEALGVDADVHAIELPGHGATALNAGVPTVESVRAHVRRFSRDRDLRRAVLWGYSQGARVALDFTLAYPRDVAALILESGTAGIEDPLARADRRSRDYALSKRLESSTIEEFVALWEAVPVLADQPTELIVAQREDRLAHDPRALAAALRGIGQSAYEPMWRRLGEIDVPTLVLTGERDKLYDAHGRRLAAGIPRARHESIPGAGHAVHLERPEAAAAVVARFLEDCGRGVADGHRRY